MRRVVLAGALLFAAAGSADAQPPDWTVRRDPFDLGLVKRYRAILAKDPWDLRAFTALRTMYKSYRTLDELVDVYKDAPEPAAMIVSARLDPLNNERWLRVIAHTEDARALLELGKLDRMTGQFELAAPLFERAAKAATDKATKRAALEELVTLTTTNKDVDRTDRIYMQLIELDPTSGKRWTERGIAMAQLGRNDLAAKAFARADDLLATDPQARLDATILRARALFASGDPDGARQAYERVLTTAPSGYYLAQEAVIELVEIHAMQNTLPVFVASLEKRWPKARRGYFEWWTLSTIYERTGDTPAALDALKRATQIAPTEIDTQRALIKMLDDGGKPDEALAQLLTAARAIPADFDLQVELANRLRAAKDTTAAVETLQRLSRTRRDDTSTHEELADLFAKWNRPGLALHEIEEVARIDPDPENVVALGDAYWTAGNEAKAFATWKRLGSSAEGLGKLGSIYVDHELWSEALATYTQAIHKYEKDRELWRARAEIYEARGNWKAAYNDAQRAVLLARGASLADGHEVRKVLVRILTHWAEHEDAEVEPSHLDTRRTEWTEGFFAEPSDRDAGYLLAELYDRTPSPDMLPVLDKLHAHEPDDRAIALARIRAYKVLHHYPEAIAALRELAQKDHSNEPDYADQIRDLEKRVALDREDRGLGTDPIADPAIVWRSTAGRYDPIAPLHAGVRMGVGSGLRGPADHSVLAGIYTEVRIARHLAFVGRLDWTQRGADAMAPAMANSMSAVAISTGVALPLFTLTDAVVTIGAAHRTELRIGDHAGWDTLGLAGDVTLEVIPKHLPGSLGLRFEQGVSDHGQMTALLVELGVGN